MSPNIVTMEQQLSKHNLSALDILCQKGYIELLKIYIPIYTDY